MGSNPHRVLEQIASFQPRVYMGRSCRDVIGCWKKPGLLAQSVKACGCKACFHTLSLVLKALHVHVHVLSNMGCSIWFYLHFLMNLILVIKYNKPKVKKKHLHFFFFIYSFCVRPLDTFGTEKTLKVHRLTNNLQGLQKVMVKDFSCNILPWNALLFEKTLKQYKFSICENYGFILNTCHNTAKRADTRVGFPVIFSRLRWPIEPKCSQVCYFI